MGSMLGDWPSFDRHNFSQLRPSDPSNPSRAEEKLRPKRAASEHLIPEHGCKQPRAST